MAECAENVFSQSIRRASDERMHCNVFAKNEQPGTSLLRRSRGIAATFATQEPESKFHDKASICSL